MERHIPAGRHVADDGGIGGMELLPTAWPGIIPIIARRYCDGEKRASKSPYSAG